MPMRIVHFRWVVIACFVVGVQAGSVWAQRDGKPARDDKPARGYVELTEAQARALEEKVNRLIREAGVIESASVSEIRANASSAILELVPQGTEVKKGDLIARLDSSELEDDLAIQRISLAKRQAESIEAMRVVDLEKSEFQTAQEIHAKRLELAQLSVKAHVGENGEFVIEGKNIDDQIMAAEQMLEARALALKSVNPGEKVKVAEGRAMMLMAEAEVASLRRRRKLHDLMTNLRSAELSLAVAEEQAELAKMMRAADAAVQKSQAMVDVAKQAEEVEKRKLKTLEEKIAGCAVVAPQDGVLTYLAPRRGQNPIEVGTAVRERQTIGQIADMTKIQVAVLVNETRIARVRTGQKATIQIDAYPGREFTGSVKRISRTPEPASFMDNSDKRYVVVVSFDQPWPEVRLGMTALVGIDTGK